MPSYFFDSSALAKRYIQEQGTAAVLVLFEKAGRLVISRLAIVEVTSALVRRQRAGEMSARQFEVVFSALSADLRQRFEVVDLGGPVTTRAVDLVRAHALRAADALQLACALIGRGERKEDSEFTFVSTDRELNAAAELEGLSILDPTAD